MMRYGIPKYRLPRDILDAEITRILDMSITLELNATVTGIQAEEGRPQHRRIPARRRLPGGGQARACLVRCPEYLVLRGRPGHRPAPARGGPADHHLRRGDRRPGLLGCGV